MALCQVHARGEISALYMGGRVKQFERASESHSQGVLCVLGEGATLPARS